MKFMKNFFKLFLMVIIITLPLAGCFKSPEERAAEEAAEQLSDIFGDLGTIKDLENLGDADVADSMAAMMKFGAEMELKEFDSQGSLDLPKDFPKGFMYDDSKVTAVSDSSSGDSVYFDVTLATKDDVDDIKSFYQKILKDSSDWTVEGESIEMGYYNITASNESNSASENIDVTIYYNDFSSLIDIDIYYSAYRF
jgi:hypothetical protein